MTAAKEPLPSGDEELWSLVEAFVTETASPAQRDRLEARLRSDRQARLFYISYLDLHAHLQWRTRGVAVPAAQGGPPLRGGKTRPGAPGPFRRSRLAVAAAWCRLRDCSSRS